MDEYLTPFDVADLLHVPYLRVQRWVKRGEMPGVVLPNGDVLIPSADLRAWLDSRRPRPSGEVTHA
jgi:excisionase family DNA binding protein